ncbi:hypothetical protein ASC95_02375 [Pelomonas sp. Root1217]|uniref:DUF6600 domain-containing protein n=1 Tax=Pelomonas sp. Root1217 TaxID=1736430 RepID=UPI00070E5E58|nr:DUF6600 domain-containing protein [Pelomonas sp. Root1217]KQV60332.1 hypothetical protein ASC95_02375 [Pelomonas sp. Root1217]
MTTSIESKLVLKRNRWRMLALALFIAVAPGVKAQDTDRDPPTRAARVVDVVGDAWLFDHDTREWTRLLRNQTVGEGDRVRTDDRARISLRSGSTSIWVDERSDLELSQLDEGQTLLQIDRGDVAVRLRNPENATETRLRTREGTAQPEREGLYRVEQLDRGSKAYVWQGRLRFEWARTASPVTLGTGEQAEFWWPDGPRAERGPLFSDGFGDWVLAESREEGDRPVARYVSPEMTGAEDLDRYGRWETAPEYGTVWIPTTVAVTDWAPYRYGRWTWTRHWGWTWVDDAPWGFAPFHYGRWVSWGGRWCWAPGAYVHRPVYAPALVGWVGGGSVSIGISVGSRPPPPRFGWYPLAPREVYVPAYHHSPRYVNRVNDPRDVRDPVTVRRPHRYRDAPAAVSTLPAPGAAIQPLPVRGPDRRPEPGWNRPLPTAPGRGDLAAVLPAAPTRPPETELPRRNPRAPEANMGWRSEGNQRPQRRDQRGPDVQPQVPVPTVAQPAVPAIAPQPQVPQQRPSVEQPQRNGDNVPWRVPQQQQQQQQQLQREAQQRDTQHREAQQREMQQRREDMQQREAQQRDAQQREAQQREMQQREMQQRREEQQRRVSQPEPQRQIEVARPQPQPQPQAQPRAQPREEGPKRGREDGVPTRGDKQPREPKQQER